MTLKNTADLKKCIPYYDSFLDFLIKFKDIIDTGKLAEYYCSRLFRLKLVKPHNQIIDAISSSGKRIEIKHRLFSGKIPPGMELNLKKIDYVYYVELEKNLLPKRIIKIDSHEISRTKGNRVSFRKAVERGKIEILYQAKH